MVFYSQRGQGPHVENHRLRGIPRSRIAGLKGIAAGVCLKSRTPASHSKALTSTPSTAKGCAKVVAWII